MGRLFLKILIIASSFLLASSVDAQQDDLPKKLQKLYQSAREAYNTRDYETAMINFTHLTEKAPWFVEPYLYLGDIHFEKKELEEGISYYRQAISANPEHSASVYVMLANAEFQVQQYDSAGQHYAAYLAFRDVDSDARKAVGEKIALCIYRAAAIENPVMFDPVNLGTHINTPDDEYINAITADGSFIYFTVKESQEDPAKAAIRAYTESFYYALFEHDGWVPRLKLGAPIDSEGDAGAMSITPEGRKMYFTACTRADSYGGCDLYYAQKRGPAWSSPRNLGNVVNAGSWDVQPSISPDGKWLYFVSNRPGGSGSSDIWVAGLREDKSWGEPQNLGPDINTPGKEMAPYIHHDGRTLYFASEGHKGMGGMDLFKTTWLDEGRWSEPVNLGYPINTHGDELAVIVSPSGDRGYISADRPDGFGKFDIYGFELYDSIRPKPVSYLKGLVYDKETMDKLEASFELVDLENGRIVMESASDAVSGEFLICLPTDAEYALNVSREGYLFYSDHFTLTGQQGMADPFLKDIPMQPVSVGSTIILNNVFFRTDKYQLEQKSFIELDRLVGFLQNNPGLHAEIGGHTDNTGAVAHNRDLSTKRAESVYNYLLEHGIKAARLTYQGYGSSMPVASNDTSGGKALNRRTEVKVVP